jgi:hypothetical protein
MIAIAKTTYKGTGDLVAPKLPASLSVFGDIVVAINHQTIDLRHHAHQWASIDLTKLIGTTPQNP